MAKKTNLIPHGRTFTGTIIQARAQKTAVMEFDRKRYVPKYERYLLERTKITVHNPAEIDAKKGDIVKVQECRPISKTKNFIVLKVMGRDQRFLEAEDFQSQSQAEDKAKLQGKKQ